MDAEKYQAHSSTENIKMGIGDCYDKSNRKTNDHEELSSISSNEYKASNEVAKPQILKIEIIK